MTSSMLSPRLLLSHRLLPVFGTVDTDKGWDSQVCPRAIWGFHVFVIDRLITLDKDSESCHLLEARSEATKSGNLIKLTK